MILLSAVDCIIISYSNCVTKLLINMPIMIVSTNNGLKVRELWRRCGVSIALCNPRQVSNMPNICKALPTISMISITVDSNVMWVLS